MFRQRLSRWDLKVSPYLYISPFFIVWVGSQRTGSGPWSGTACIIRPGTTGGSCSTPATPTTGGNLS